MRNPCRMTTSLRRKGRGVLDRPVKPGDDSGGWGL